MQASRRLVVVLSGPCVCEKRVQKLECGLSVYLHGTCGTPVITVRWRRTLRSPCCRELAELRRCAICVHWRGAQSQHPNSRFWKRLRLALPVRPLALGRRLIDSTSSHSDLAAMAMRRTQTHTRAHNIAGFPYDVIAAGLLRSPKTATYSSVFRVFWIRAWYRQCLSCSVEMWRGYRFLFVIMLALQLVSAGDNFVVRNVQGIMGRSVHMRCVLERINSIDRVYFQKTARNGSITFINGFYSRILPVPAEYINRTIVNKTQLSMELFNLFLTDEGEYTCIPFIKDVTQTQTKFHLKVAANYNIPTTTVQGCGLDPEAHNCVIICSSSGGFPKSNVTWHVAGGEMRSLLRDEGELMFMQDEQSKLWNVSQEVRLNCSWPLNITCSVGGVVSQAVSVCPPIGKTLNLTPIACAVLLLVSFVIVIVIIKCRRAVTRTPSEEGSRDAELASLNSDQAG